MGLFPGWPIDHVIFALSACYALLTRTTSLKDYDVIAAPPMGVMAAAYALYYLVPGFIRGSRVMIGYIGKERASAPLFSWRCYYCLCASESATTVACAAMFYDAGWLGLRGAVLLAVLGNLAGYAKYLVQMWYDHEYVATSIFLYLLMFLVLAICQRDPLYYVLMVYPFMVLLQVPEYSNMKGRKILYDNESIILHCVDHLIHGTITCSVAVYHFFGLPPLLLVHLFVVPLGYCITQGTTSIQQQLSKAK